MQLGLGLGGSRRRWTPASLFALGEQGAWYDPSDFSTMFQDSAGTTPVTGVGQPVGKILDKSGRGNHAAQATTTARPVLQQDPAGFYHLLGDGVDDFLATGAPIFGGIAAAEAMHVAAHPTGTTTGGAAFTVKGIHAQTSHEPFTDGIYYSDFVGSARGAFGKGLDGIAQPYVLNQQHSGAAVSAYKNGVQMSVAVASGITGVNSAALLLRSPPATPYFYNGRFYAGLAIGRALAPTERALLLTWMARKAGLAL